MSLSYMPLTTLVLLTAAPLAGQAPAAPCNSSAHGAFDFWVGHWQVINAVTGELAGVNHIERMDRGCVIRERYQAAGGYTGQSLNWYDAGTRVWHQLWLDSDGLILQLAGGLDTTGAMVLDGRGHDSLGTSFERIRWEVRSDGSIRQLWTQARTPHGPWSTLFDGVYRRRDP